MRTRAEWTSPSRRSSPRFSAVEGASAGAADEYLDPGQKARFLFLDAPRTTITIVIEAPTREFDAYMAQAQEVLDSMAFE
jgi:hypothetical protein